MGCVSGVGSNPVVKKTTFYSIMTNYRPLQNIPLDLNNDYLSECIQQKEQYVHMIDDWNSLLGPNIKKLFNNLNLTPQFVSLFGKQQLAEQKIWIHTDILWKDNQWIKLPFGINWELYPSDTYFNWWDTKDQTECYPPSIDNSTWSQATNTKFRQQGIHYGTRENYDFHNSEIIETLKFEPNTAYLVRADVPHNVEYKTDNIHRIGISIRFPVEQIATWQQALSTFDPYIKK